MATLDSFVDRKLLILHTYTSAYEAARAMCAREVGCVLIDDERGNLVGIVTDRDLACQTPLMVDRRGGYTEEGNEQEELLLSEIMTENPLSIDADSTIDEAARLMEDQGIRRIPILKPGTRHPIGLVTLDDLIATESLPPGRLARIIRSQILRRSVHRPRTMREQVSELRSAAHRESTLNRFYHLVAQFLQSAPAAPVDELTRIVLEALVRRIPYTTAVNLISQLPADLQMTLLELPAGPDRSITVDSLLKTIESTFQLKSSEAPLVLKNFLLALDASVSRGELDHVLAQLPRDFRAYFPEHPESEKRPQSAA